MPVSPLAVETRDMLLDMGMGREAAQVEELFFGGRLSLTRFAPVKSPWQPYVGKVGARKGVKGWKNTVSGRVVWGPKPKAPAKKKAPTAAAVKKKIAAMKEYAAKSKGPAVKKKAPAKAKPKPKAAPKPKAKPKAVPKAKAVPAKVGKAGGLKSGADVPYLQQLHEMGQLV